MAGTKKKGYMCFEAERRGANTVFDHKIYDLTKTDLVDFFNMIILEEANKIATTNETLYGQRMFL